MLSTGSLVIAHPDSLHTSMSNIANAKTRRKQQGTGIRSVTEIRETLAKYLSISLYGAKERRNLPGTNI